MVVSIVISIPKIMVFSSSSISEPKWAWYPPNVSRFDRKYSAVNHCYLSQWEGNEFIWNSSLSKDVMSVQYHLMQFTALSNKHQTVLIYHSVNFSAIRHTPQNPPFHSQAIRIFSSWLYEMWAHIATSSIQEWPPTRQLHRKTPT